MSRKYGYIPDVGDHRDRTFSAPAPITISLPPQFSLRESMPPVYDQANLGSCVANAIAAAYVYDLDLIGDPDDFDFVEVSRLFLYYNARALEHRQNQDSGVSIRSGVKALASTGICEEECWPYHTSDFAIKPPVICYESASPHTTYEYSRVAQSLTQLKAAIFSGFPVVFGFSVYDSFESPELASTGIMHLPDANENLLGGHAVLMVGWSDLTNTFEIRNSWSANWGQEGYFQMPYAYGLDHNLAMDFWVIKGVS